MFLATVRRPYLNVSNLAKRFFDIFTETLVPSPEMAVHFLQQKLKSLSLVTLYFII